MPTDTISSSATKRARRIERRCIPAVVKAFQSGQISARSADVFLSLPQAEQAQELERRLSEAHERETGHRLVAEAIRGYLDGLGGQKVDLIELGKIIRETLAFAKPN
jgi:hypothetical protein